MSKPNPYGSKARAKADSLARSKKRNDRYRTTALKTAILSHYQNTLAPQLGLNPHSLLALPPSQARNWFATETEKKQGINQYLPPLLFPFPGYDRSAHMLWITPTPAHALPTLTARAVAKLLQSFGHAHRFVSSVAQFDGLIQGYLFP